ncbi:DUF4382 domain-containing protein [Aquiflexum lacus]|uniref:DUF4382 domain-containing protein n=1 Tax=Aquiflexum lacus TaxID=2483805 RepID=UPI001894281C|nr:DUF4382 domain-containing protein [Aquiflexum lacus]
MKIKQLLILLLLYLNFGCSGTEERSTALVNVFLVGTPGFFEEVGIEILGVEVQVTGTRGQDNAEAVFLSNLQANQQANLSTLVNTGQYLIGRGEFLVGAITELKLSLGDDNYVILGGDRFVPRFVDNAAENPVMPVSIPLDGGISHDIFIDFNTLESILFTGGTQGEFLLAPDFRAFSSINTGDIAGIIRPQTQKSLILAIQGLDTLASTTQNPQGNFLIRGLNGEVTVFIYPFSDSFLPDTVNNVLVEPRQRTQLGEINLRPIP